MVNSGSALSMATSNVAVWPGRKHKSQVTIIRNFTRVVGFCWSLWTQRAKPNKNQLNHFRLEAAKRCRFSMSCTKDLPWYSDMDAWFVSLALFQKQCHYIEMSFRLTLVSFISIHFVYIVFVRSKSKNLHHKKDCRSEAALSHLVQLYRFCKFCMSFLSWERQKEAKWT